MQAGSCNVGMYGDAFLIFTSDPKRCGKMVTSVQGLRDLELEIDADFIRHARMLEFVNLLLFVDIASFGKGWDERAAAAIGQAVSGLSIGRVLIDTHPLSPEQQALMLTQILDVAQRAYPRYLFQLYIY